MMKKIFTKSEKANINYLSRVVRIDNIRPHSNADRLEIVTIEGANIILAKDSVKIGDIMIYCQTESALNMDFLSKNNQFEDKTLNVDKNVKSFFNKKGRVRAINLRGEPSRAFLFPPTWLQVWQPDLKIDKIEDYIDVEFDTVNGELFSKKYVARQPRERGQSSGKSNKRNKKLQGFDKLIENQFSYHYDTGFLSKNLHKIDPNDTISITYKLHGTSGIFSNVLINRQLNWFEKLLIKLGVKVETKEYGNIVSSRSVIKNRFINKDVGRGFYGVDIWMEASKKVLPVLAKGETAYSEIVGYLPGSSKMIQKGHDYGCNVGEYEVYVYRVTTTNADGIVTEMSATQVQQWCKSRGLNAVPQLYYGKAKDVYPDIDTEQHWRVNFCNRLKTDKERFYMEDDDPMCENSVPFEGVCIRNDSDIKMTALKMKTDRHYGYETALLDLGEINIEDEQSEDDEQ